MSKRQAAVAFFTLAQHKPFRADVCRRHAVFEATGDAVLRTAHQPHYQAISNNPLQGGIERWFEPVEDAVASSG